MTISVFGGFQILLILNLGEFQILQYLNGFRGIPVKVHKSLVKFMDFQSCSPSIFYGISSVVHEVCVWIFSGIAYCNNLYYRLLLLQLTCVPNMNCIRLEIAKLLRFCHPGKTISLATKYRRTLNVLVE